MKWTERRVIYPGRTLEGYGATKILCSPGQCATPQSMVGDVIGQEMKPASLCIAELRNHPEANASTIRSDPKENHKVGLVESNVRCTDSISVSGLAIPISNYT